MVDDVDILTCTEQDVDKYQDDLVTQVEMVLEQVCKSGPLLYHNMCLYFAIYYEDYIDCRSKVDGHTGTFNLAMYGI